MFADKTWNVAFGLAVIVMVISLIKFAFTQKKLGSIGVQPGYPLSEFPNQKIAKWKEIAVYAGTLVVIL